MAIKDLLTKSTTPQNDLFIKATRKKMRFPYRGLISVEDLWDLSVRHLDEIYKTLNAKVRKSSEESLLDMKTEEDDDLNTQIEIIKYIVSVKLEEKEAADLAKKNKETVQKLLSIKASREAAKLENLSDEELDAMINNLQ